MTMRPDAAETYQFSVSVDAPAKPENRRRLMWPEKEPIPAWIAEKPYRTRWIEQRRSDGHAERVRTSGYLYGETLRLDADRCRFGPRRLSLMGTLNAATPQQATDTLFDLTQWTLAQVYGADRDNHRRVALTGLRLSLNIAPPSPSSRASHTR